MPFFHKKAPFLSNIERCPKFLEYALLILNLCHWWHWRIQNPLKYLKWSVLRKQLTAKMVNYFRKILHLRCFTGFWIRLWMTNWDLTVQKNLKTKCFYNSKSWQTKTILHPVFETFTNNSSRYKTQMVLWWVLWVGDDRNIHIFIRAFLLKIIIGAWSCLSCHFQVL